MMFNAIRLRKLSGIETPDFRTYIKSTVVKGSEIELTEAQWNAIDLDEKGLFEGKKHVLVSEMGMIKLLPIKTAFIGGIDNKPKQTPVTPHEDTIDATKADGGDPEVTADDMVKAVDSGKKKTDSSEVVKEDDDMEDDEDEESEGDDEVNESAEDKAKLLIKSIRGGKRVTSTSSTGTDAVTTVDKPASELGSASVKDNDLGGNDDKPLKKVEAPKSEPEDTKAVGGNPVTEETAEDIAKRIIAAVKAGNPPHEAHGASDSAEKKTLSFDYNSDISDAPAKDDAEETANLDAKVGAEVPKSAVEVPSEVTSQIDARLNDLRAASDEFDPRGMMDSNVKLNAIDFLEKMKQLLGMGSVEGFQQAQINFQKLMGPITDLLPSALVLFLATGRNQMNKNSGFNVEVK
jgi:DNA polymerase III gamma/tau subunit